MGKKLVRGVYALNGTFYPAGSEPPKELVDSEFTNPKLWDESAGGAPALSDGVDPEPVPVSSPTLDDANAEAAAANGSDDTGSAKPAPKKAPAKKAVAKKATTSSS